MAASALPLLAASLGAQSVSYSNPYTISLLAGSAGSGGLQDGTGTGANFNSPSGVAVDGSGNVYVADTDNDAIRKVTQGGVTTTLVSAGLGPVYGIAIDSQGNLYVTDWVNNAGTSAVLRMITSGGNVSTLATGFDQPQGLTVDGSGNIYVADTGSDTIKKVTPGGTVSVYAGTTGQSGYQTGGVGTGQFGVPTSVAVDSSGNLYVTDAGDSVIWKVSTGGTMSVYSGNAQNPYTTDGSLGSANYSHPAGITIDGSGNLYLIDDSTLVRKISGGTVSTLAGVLGVYGELNGTGQNAEFNFQAAVGGIAATASGNLAIADTNNDTIRWGAPLPANQAPTIQAQPTGESVGNGGTATLAVTASGANLTYQWYFNDGTANQAISGATSSTLQLSNIGANQEGTYTVVVTDSSGSTTSNGAVVTVLTNALLTNISTRANVGTGASQLDAGFVLSGTGTKPMLVRGAGPALAQFNVTGYLTNPVLTLDNSVPTTLFTNQGWDNNAQLSAAFTQTGAFAFPANSLDSALLPTLGAGQYSAIVSGANNTTGNAIVEVYDDDTADTSLELINISTRAYVTPTAGLTAGFYIGGSTPMTVLIRGIGPALSGFGVSGALPNTSLTVYNTSQAVMGTNTGWGGSTSLSDMFSKVGAFGLQSGSADSALIVTLQPGGYTAQLTDSDGTSSGVALVEVYEIR